MALVISSRRKEKPPVTMRGRDIAAILAVLISGVAMIYTSLEQGKGMSANLTVVAFLVSAGLLFIGYGGGAIVDRLGRRYPSTTKERHSPVVFILLLALIAGGAWFGWQRRDAIARGADDWFQSVMVSIDAKVDEHAFW